MASPIPPIDMAAVPAWRLILTGATLRYVWRIPLLVGTLLTLVNQGSRLADGFDAAVVLPVVFNYVTPYVVSSLGFLAAQRPKRQRTDLSGAAPPASRIGADGSTPVQTSR